MGLFGWGKKNEDDEMSDLFKEHMPNQEIPQDLNDALQKKVKETLDEQDWDSEEEETKEE